MRGYGAAKPISPLAKCAASADCLGMERQRSTLNAFLIPGLILAGIFIIWRNFAAIVFIPLFFVLLLVGASCGGLRESEWRGELEPLLPEGVTIVDSRTEDCWLEPKTCEIIFILEHDHARYAEDVAAFEAAMVAEGWEQPTSRVTKNAARTGFKRSDIGVYLRLWSAPGQEECAASLGGLSACQSTLTVRQR